MDVRFFKSFSGFSHPIKLNGEISEEESKLRNAFLKAYYHKAVLIKVEKYLDDALFFSCEYFYEADSLVKAVIRNSEKENEIIFKQGHCVRNPDKTH